MGPRKQEGDRRMLARLRPMAPPPHAMVKREVKGEDSDTDNDLFEGMGAGQIKSLPSEAWG